MPRAGVRAEQSQYGCCQQFPHRRLLLTEPTTEFARVESDCQPTAEGSLLTTDGVRIRIVDKDPAQRVGADRVSTGAPVSAGTIPDAEGVRWLSWASRRRWIRDGAIREADASARDPRPLERCAEARVRIGTGPVAGTAFTKALRTFVGRL